RAARQAAPAPVRQERADRGRAVRALRPFSPALRAPRWQAWGADRARTARSGDPQTRLLRAVGRQRAAQTRLQALSLRLRRAAAPACATLRARRKCESPSGPDGS